MEKSAATGQLDADSPTAWSVYIIPAANVSVNNSVPDQHKSRWVETRHSRPHPQTRQTEEGARQLQTHLPDIPPRESVREGDQESTRIPLRGKENVTVCEAGFRRGPGVTDHVVKLGEQVGREVGRRKVLLTCFFDISRACDQVWHAKLLQSK